MIESALQRAIRNLEWVVSYLAEVGLPALGSVHNDFCNPSQFSNDFNTPVIARFQTVADSDCGVAIR
ncbi:hypothetical protein KR51_00013010 [Rubidibacter lacunae KORDI 51-2]|uniref:Uncharacterized protein n=1 Tax=Rubidibacter lacunae KORDI 51-2 TaxID=582515 RepID=U5DJV5_9CHRO|nr:hypothetical protein KR51_00013010 [Rubidibacter lacunae KORDI 51-2]